MNNNSGNGNQQGHYVQYSEEQKAHIKYNLERSLGPEYVSFRPAAGGSEVIYIEGWKALNLANQIFGFNGWSSEVRSTQVDYVDNMGGKWSLGLSSIVRVTLKDGTYHEDIGYGHIENCRTKAQAFEKAKKEAITDAVKRALRQFGNVLGNCLYEKNYLQRVKQVKRVERVATDDQLLRPEENIRPKFDANGKLVRENLLPLPSKISSSAAALIATPANQDATEDAPLDALPDKIIPEDSYMDDSFLFSDEVFEEAIENENAGQEGPSVQPRANAPQANRQSSDAAMHTPAPRFAPSHNLRTPQIGDPSSTPGPVGFVSTRAAKDIIASGRMKSPLPVNDKLAFNPQVRTPLHHRNILDPTRSAPVKKSPLTARKDDVPSSKRPVGEYEKDKAQSQENINPTADASNQKRQHDARDERPSLSKRIRSAANAEDQ